MTRTTKTLDQILDDMEKLDEQNWDQLVPWRDLTLEPPGPGPGRGLVLKVPGRTLRPSYHAFAQLCHLLGMPPGYAVGLPSKLLLDLFALERRRRKVDAIERPLLIRGCGDKVRGVLSRAYTPLDDAKVVRAVRDALGEIKVHIQHLRWDLDLTELRMVFLDSRATLTRTGRGEDLVGLGLFVRNSEVGAATLAVGTYLYRHFCTNGLILNDNVYRWRHMGVRPQTVVASVAAAVRRVIERGPAVADAFDRTTEVKVYGGARRSIEVMARHEGLSKEMAELLDKAYREDPNDSLFGVINAVTAMARKQPPAMRTELELLAGKLLEWPARCGVEAS